MDAPLTRRGRRPKAHHPPRDPSKKDERAKLRAARRSAAQEKVAEVATAVGARIAPDKHDTKNPFGPNIITHERVLGNITIRTPFGTINMNPSELHQIRPMKGGGTELIQVVDPDGSTGIETVLWRHPVYKGWRVEVQGPAIYGGPGGLPAPLSARFFGVGLTKDWVDDKAKEAASVTVELKITSEDAARLAALAVPGSAAAVASALESVADNSVATVIGSALAGAVPIVSAMIAASTIVWAVKTCRDPNAATSDKALAIAHAVADSVRVVMPMTGTVANVALVFVALGVAWWKKHFSKGEAVPATGPPLPAAPPPRPTLGSLPEGA